MILITDGKYRMAIAAVMALGEAGQELVVCQTMEDVGSVVPAFYSKYVKSTFLLNCSCNDEEKYKEELLELCKKINYEEKIRTVILPIGAKTLMMLAKNKDELSEYADFIVASPEVLNNTNDKTYVHEIAKKLNIKIPLAYERGGNEKQGAFLGRIKLPAVVKPKNGEQHGMHASERYKIVKSYDDLIKVYNHYRKYEPYPIVQEQIQGEGVGISIVMDMYGEAISVIGHKRVREYPITGGPSTCCISYYNCDLIKQSIALLKELNYIGIAMVEYKGNDESGYSLLEINPRVWGTFPLTYKAKSNFSMNWLRASKGEKGLPLDDKFKVGKKMQFIVSDLIGSIKYITKGQVIRGMGGLVDTINPYVSEGIFKTDDSKPFWAYILSKIKK